ncbi:MULTISPECIES: glycosyltransferase family 2 protein [unclassified Adlercreutzia]|uniref:glycosyltransferase family 2 protein n=1 Tax=unclassified Adlercreutzia TaxID=2636013 RepID=UPI0013EAEE11|nr:MULTISPECIES: glycosyltransferase family 2 protein [unclassified Adlercreutzia]
MQHPKLSFVVPAYNIDRYLDECLESLCGQTYSNLEIICVDDGSSDNSLDVLRKWEQRDSRVKVISQTNKGVSRARNEGMRQATGDYIGFVDGDDYLDLDAAEKMVEKILAHEADIVVYGGRAFPETQWVTEVFGPRDVVREGDGRFMIFEERGCIPSASNKVYRRSLLEQNDLEFNESLILGEDTSLQFLIFPLAQRVVFMSNRFYHYRFNREGSAVTEEFKNKLPQLLKHIDVFRYISNEWDQRGYLADCKPQFLDCISFIFSDFSELNSEERLAFSAKFASAYAQHFSHSDLKGISSGEARYRYELFLDLASGKSARRAELLYSAHAALSGAYRRLRAIL